MAVVKADDVATKAASKMPGQIRQLETAIKQLQKSARNDLGKAHWDGKNANEFQNNIWPDAEKVLNKTITALEELQKEVQRVLRDIMQAGGNT
ncbi:MAG: hypothetical protein ACR2H3_14300 [Acidimicrobiales bacterium]